jgi:hypothetical protein
MRLAVASCAALALILGCAGPKPLGWERQIDGGEAPAWTDHPGKMDTKDAKAFAGVSLDEAMEGSARDGALKNARQQIIDALGTYGRHTVNQVIVLSKTEGGILDPEVIGADATELVSESEIASRAKEFHIEKWQRVTEEGLKTFYKAYVLVLYSNEDAEQAVKSAVRRQAQAAQDEQVRKNIEHALEEMKKLESPDW